MLRTFDELGYRQEQRFHLELGLLKLVHLRRLLPIEEVLSQSGGGSRSPSTSTRSAVSTSAPRASAPASTAPTQTRPAFSPFEQDRSRRGVESAVSAPIPAAPVSPAPVAQVRGATAVAPQPRIVPESRPAQVPQPVLEPVATIELARSTEPGPAVAQAQSGSFDDLQQRAIDALRNAKQSSAADAMEDAQWTVADGEARIQTELSKTMLPVVMNAEAEKLVRAVAREAGVTKLTLLPGAPSAGATKKPKTARTGSVQAKALEHPMVQQAQKLFNAEIQTVIDLREGE